MKESYNYTFVERHKQKIFIPYIGAEFNGWGIVFAMFFGVLAGVVLIGIPLSFLLGDVAFLLAIAIIAIAELATILFVNDLDREAGKNKLKVIYYTNIKKYRIIYDKHGKSHFISRKKEGVIYYNVC